MNSKNSKLIGAAVIGLIVVVAIAIVGGATNLMKNMTNPSSNKSLDEMLENVKVMTATPVKGSVSLENNLYDELPEIDKYPLQVKGTAEVNIEIFTSGEKAGKNNDKWLIDCAEKFNSQKNVLSLGQTVSVSVRSVPSGLAADYIISEKYVPDLYTPSNTLFGDYAIAEGGSLELYNERLVGNTAGILIKKNSDLKTYGEIIKAVSDNKLSLGYTNPQTSAAGLNLLLQILKDADPADMLSDAASDAFSKFNNNIPFVAHTTQQMAQSAANGTLDGMITEYQAYINDDNLKSLYEFIPFGMRHDNPLYIVDQMNMSQEKIGAVELLNDYLMSDEAQKLAAKYGFNANDDYKSAFTASGAEVSQSLKIYKSFKDSGKDIIAVFVADCSESMSGEPMNQLKTSLSNGMQYINENNFVGLVSYDKDVTIELPIAEFDLDQKAYFQGAVNNLTPTGTTSTYEAILIAQKMINESLEAHPDAKAMIFLLSDGYANGRYSLSDVRSIIEQNGTPIYTIGYTKESDENELNELSGINEAAFINADADDIVYKIKSLFNSQL